MYHVASFLFQTFFEILKFNFQHHIGGGHFENLDLALKYQFKKNSINTNTYINSPSNNNMIH